MIKSFPTDRASVWFFVTMNQMMPLQIRFVGKMHSADVTSKWFLPGMNSHMKYKLTFLKERLATDLADMFPAWSFHGLIFWYTSTTGGLFPWAGFRPLASPKTKLKNKQEQVLEKQ